MDELVLYAYTFRSRAERVLWTLRELAMPHRVVRLDPFGGATRTAEFLQLNPAAKIPVLVHGERVLTESIAIMEYLNDISASRHLIPKGAADNSRFRRILHFGLTELEPYLWLADQAGRLKQIYRWPDGTKADVDVRGWVNEPTQAARDKWIGDFSDHSLLFLEVQRA